MLASVFWHRDRTRSKIDSLENSNLLVPCKIASRRYIMRSF